MLCQLCSGLDLAAIVQIRLEEDFNISRSWDSRWSEFEECDNVIHFRSKSHNDTDHKREEILVPYHKTLEDLYRAAENCDLCRALLCSAAGMIRIRERMGNEIRKFSHGSSVELHLCGLSSGQGIQLMALDADYVCAEYWLLGGVGLSVDNDSSLVDIIPGRTISKSPRSSYSLLSVEKWLSTCSTQHGHHITDIAKPSRLLKYDYNRGKVSLCNSPPSGMKYAALSHCWGSVQPFTLNTGTKHQLKEGLPLESFPKTFQDAFWLIQKLSIPYIWIDSLCIVQDDQDDWVHESARMCDIYGNAYLTISATRARNCSEGFLGPITGHEYTYIPFKQDGTHGSVAIFPMPLSQVIPWGDIIGLADEPLSKRAWALQERYLSPRTVHFASTQMYFECRSGFYPQDRHFQHENSKMNFKIHRRATAKDENAEDTWGVIVYRYTERYLTMESDKLPAIGGIAKRVFLERHLHDNPGGEYLAGLWRESLLCDLAWLTDTGEERGVPTSYTAPSWSWASVNGPIAFRQDHDTQRLAVVKDAKVDLENSENPFGRVTGGWIHLCGIKLHPCDVDDYGGIYIRTGDARCHVSTIMDFSRFNLPGVHGTDYKDKKSELVAVPLMLEEEDDDNDHNPGAHFLLLVSSTSGQGLVNGLPCFRRVGVGSPHIVNLDENDGDARRRLRDRCVEAMEQGTLEDFIIV